MGGCCAKDDTKKKKGNDSDDGKQANNGPNPLDNLVQPKLGHPSPEMQQQVLEMQTQIEQLQNALKASEMKKVLPEGHEEPTVFGSPAMRESSYEPPSFQSRPQQPKMVESTNAFALRQERETKELIENCSKKLYESHSQSVVAGDPNHRNKKDKKNKDDDHDDPNFDYQMRDYKMPAVHTDRKKTVMVIGETGSGKSTLINAIANYASGVEYNTPVRYRVVKEETRDQSQSQTQNVTSYDILIPTHSYKLQLIDTPGFGDTSGVERDEQITKDIYDFLQKQDEIHAVCFVVASSLPRLTVTQQYIINKVLTMFGKDAKNNMFLLATFADGKVAQVLSAVKASGFPYNEQSCFHFNNSALYANGNDRNVYSKNFWSMGTNSLSAFFTKLNTVQPFNLNHTKDVIATQRKLQNYVASITPQVTIGLSKIDNLKLVLQDIKLNRDKINENANYTYKETIPKVQKLSKSPGTYNTQCLKCSYNCHHDCTRSNDDDKQYCCAMDLNGNCTVCPEKCSWRDHANLDYYFEWSTQVVSRKYDTKKLQLDAAKTGLSRSEALKQDVLTELNEVCDNVHNLMTSIHQAHAKLDEIALRPSNLQFEDYLKVLIEQEKLHKRPGFSGRIEQLHIMLEQAKITRDIRENNYDPIKNWKTDVEKELQSVPKWEPPKEPSPEEEAAAEEEDNMSETTSSSGSDLMMDGGVRVQFPDWVVPLPPQQPQVSIIPDYTAPMGQAPSWKAPPPVRTPPPAHPPATHWNPRGNLI